MKHPVIRTWSIIITGNLWWNWNLKSFLKSQKIINFNKGFKKSNFILCIKNKKKWFCISIYSNLIRLQLGIFKEDNCEIEGKLKKNLFHYHKQMPKNSFAHAKSLARAWKIYVTLLIYWMQYRLHLLYWVSRFGCITNK